MIQMHKNNEEIPCGKIKEFEKADIASDLQSREMRSSAD